MPGSAQSAPGNGKRTLSTPSLSQESRSYHALRSLVSPLLSRLNFATKHDLHFDGHRNLQTALGRADKLTISDYRARFCRGGISTRLVDVYPNATWSGSPSIFEDPDPNIQTTFEQEVLSLFDRLDVWSRLCRADILAGLGRYSILLIGDGGKLSEELRRMSSPDDIIFLTPLAEDNAKLGDIEEDETSPRFGLPLFYNVKLSTGNENRIITTEQRAHYSRVIHVADKLLENDLYGTPRLEAVWDYIDDLIKVVGGGSEAFFSRADPGMQFDYSPEDPTQEVTAEQITELKEQIEEFRHGLQRNLYTRDVEITPLSMTVANFGPNVQSILELIAGTGEIPVRKLIGSERGELASSQDEDNFNSAVANRRSQFAVPLTNRFITRLIEYGALSLPRQWGILWPEEEELNESEKADVLEKIARANKAQVESKQPALLSSAEIRDRLYRMEPLEEEDNEEDLDEEAEAEEDDNSDSIRAAALDQRILIIGGPRRGKSTLARQYRDQGIPTYCTDPLSLVKDVEDGVTYLPEGYDWSSSAQFVAENWLSMPGPWCIEGIQTARAVRKLVRADQESVLSGVEIIVLQNPRSEVDITDKQNSSAKAVMTVWSEVKDKFPNAKYLDAPEPTTARSAQSSSIARSTPKYQRFVVGRNKLPRHGRKSTPIVKAAW